MRISIPGAFIAAIVISLIGWIWEAHFGGVAPAGIPGAIVATVKSNYIAAAMALANSLLIAVGLGWIIGKFKDRSIATGLVSGVGAFLFFVLTTISGMYVKSGNPMGPDLHPLLMTGASHLLLYVVAGLIMGAMAPRKTY